MTGLAQNEMKAKPAPPERVRSMEGLGTSFFGLKLNAAYVLEHEVIGSAAGDDHDVA